MFQSHDRDSSVGNPVPHSDQRPALPFQSHDRDSSVGNTREREVPMSQQEFQSHDRDSSVGNKTPARRRGQWVSRFNLMIEILLLVTLVH